jgi:trimeric autotransporter adhesin
MATISITQANASTDGYLSSTDWNTFNNKVSSGDFTESATFTAHVEATGNGNHIPSGGITDANVATGAAIAFSKLSGVQAALSSIAAPVTFNDRAISNYAIRTKVVSGSTYTFLASDNGKQIIFMAVGGVTATVPSGLPWVSIGGDEFEGWNAICTRGAGAGAVTVQAGASVTMTTRTIQEGQAVSILPTQTQDAYRVVGAFD